MDTTALIVDEMRPAAAYVLGYEARMQEEEKAGRTWELRSLERILDRLDKLAPYRWDAELGFRERVFDQEGVS